jgi:hypothetical protein
MRILGAVVALALLLGPVYAQNAGMGGVDTKGGAKRRPNSDQPKVDERQKKAAEDAYKAGLKAIPDAKEKYDPWKNAR